MRLIQALFLIQKSLCAFVSVYTLLLMFKIYVKQMCITVIKWVIKPWHWYRYPFKFQKVCMSLYQFKRCYWCTKIYAKKMCFTMTKKSKISVDPNATDIGSELIHKGLVYSTRRNPCFWKEQDWRLYSIELNIDQIVFFFNDSAATYCTVVRHYYFVDFGGR